jgi:hypothetical protein
MPRIFIASASLPYSIRQRGGRAGIFHELARFLGIRKTGFALVQELVSEELSLLDAGLRKPKPTGVSSSAPEVIAADAIGS